MLDGREHERCKNNEHAVRAAHWKSRMTITEISRKGPGAAAPAEKTALETAAVTRLLVSQGILDYSGHVSARIPGRDAFIIQIGSTSRARRDIAGLHAGRRLRRQGDRG